MGALLMGPKLSRTVQSSTGRLLLAALCTLLALVAITSSRSIPGWPQLSGNSDRRIGKIHSHNAPSDPRFPATGSPGVYAVSSNLNFNCGIDVHHLRNIQQKYNLDESFQYVKKYVRFTRIDGLKRKRMTHLPQSLLSNEAFKVVDITKDYRQELCDNVLEVQLPASGFPSTVNASDFIFGVSTSFERVTDPDTTPVDEWAFWLTDGRGHSNGGKLVLMLLHAGDDELQHVAHLLRERGIDVDLHHADPSQEMAVRYLSLVPTLYTHPDARSKKWLVTCDDDTFFPSMHGLIDRMGKLDHTREMYVGTLSEDTGSVERHGSQAFGGGGVFLSSPLARKITERFGSCVTEQKIVESDSGWGPQGDILLRKCIYENTDIKLTVLWDLWQLDILGHPAGFYEWGIKPLSVHHYRGGGWHKAKPGMYAKVAHACGEDCTLMRFQTKDDFIISGYSISHYPEGVNFDTNQLEATLHAAPEDKGWNLDFMMGPQRPNLERTGRKISWDLEESEVQVDGSVLQTYIRSQRDDRWVYSDLQPMSNIDGVIELVWASF